MRRLALALAAVACCFATPASAQSSSTGAALNWSRLPGAEACPNIGELARRVATQLKRDAFVSPTAATVFVDVTIEPAEPGFRIRILLSSRDLAPPGERELTSSSPDCNEAVDSAALAIALMLDPDALTRGNEPEPPPPEVSAAVASSTPPASAPTITPAASRPVAQVAPKTARPTRHTRGQTRLALGGLGAIDQVPGTDFGVTGGLRLTNPARSHGIELGLTYLVPQRLEVRNDAGGQFSLVGLGASYSWSLVHRGSWVLSLLAGAQTARMFASGFGFTGSNRDVGSWMVSGTLEGEAALVLNDHWDLALRMGLGLPVWRDTFEATTAAGTTVIVDRAPLYGSLGLALAFSP